MCFCSSAIFNISPCNKPMADFWLRHVRKSPCCKELSLISINTRHLGLFKTCYTVLKSCIMGTPKQCKEACSWRVRGSGVWLWVSHRRPVLSSQYTDRWWNSDLSAGFARWSYGKKPLLACTVGLEKKKYFQNVKILLRTIEILPLQILVISLILVANFCGCKCRHAVFELYRFVSSCFMTTLA